MDIRKSINEILKDTKPVDVLFVNSPSRWIKDKPGRFPLANEYLDNSSNNSKRLYGDQDHEPNHGLLSVISYSRAKGINVGLVDLHTIHYFNDKKIIDIDPAEYFKSVLKNKKPKIVAFSSMIPNLKYTLELASIARGVIGKEIPIVLGGLASTDPEQCLNGNIDVVVLGEGEYIFCELVERLLNKKPINNLPAIGFKDKFGKIMSTFLAPLRGSTNILPAYDLLPKELELIPRMYTSRGCGNACDFCSPDAFFNHCLKIRKHEEVLEEIEELHKNYEFDNFLIGDLTKVSQFI